MIEISNGILSARIKPMGAELCALSKGGQEYLWQAGPEWAKHSPVLFPIIGQVCGDHCRVDGREYSLPRHGFAREREFALASASADQACFRLESDAASLAVYPFAFRLTLDYALQGNRLRVTYRVENPADAEMIFSLGAHPAFHWPDNIRTLEFAAEEPAPVRRLEGGLLSPHEFPTPVAGKALPLSADLFIADALIFDQATSRSVKFGSLRLSWCEAMGYLGLWSKPGAAFLCIEPWAGVADPVGFSGEFRDKPGVVILPARGEAEFWWEVEVG